MASYKNYYRSSKGGSTQRVVWGLTLGYYMIHLEMGVKARLVLKNKLSITTLSDVKALGSQRPGYDFRANSLKIFAKSLSLQLDVTLLSDNIFLDNFF